MKIDQFNKSRNTKNNNRNENKKMRFFKISFLSFNFTMKL